MRIGLRPLRPAARAGSSARNEPRPDLRDDNGVDPGHRRALFLPTTGDEVLPEPVGVPSTHSRGVDLLIGTTLEEANLGFGADEFAAFDAHDALAELAATYPDAERSSNDTVSTTRPSPPRKRSRPPTRT